MAVGVWAFADPSSFYENIALFPPYNRHLLHDIGAFQIGLGAALLLSLWIRDSVAVALIGSGIGSAMHALAHDIAMHMAVTPARPCSFWILAVVLLVAGTTPQVQGSAVV